MVLLGDTQDITRPGQFVNIKLDNFYLRRPISVCDREEGVLTIVYKVVGKGTEVMAGMGSGEKLNVLSGLGNGYDISKSGDNPLLLGGGVGVPPLYMLCKELIKAGKEPTVILGFNSSDEIILAEDFRALGANVIVTTVDGSYTAPESRLETAIAIARYVLPVPAGPIPNTISCPRTART